MRRLLLLAFLVLPAAASGQMCGEQVYLPDEAREQQLLRVHEAMRACP